jgi:hypothetical protein
LASASTKNSLEPIETNWRWKAEDKAGKHQHSRSAKGRKDDGESVRHFHVQILIMPFCRFPSILTSSIHQRHLADGRGQNGGVVGKMGIGNGGNSKEMMAVYNKPRQYSDGAGQQPDTQIPIRVSEGRILQKKILEI